MKSNQPQHISKVLQQFMQQLAVKAVHSELVSETQK